MLVCNTTTDLWEIAAEQPQPIERGPIKLVQDVLHNLALTLC
jgi:hypothetical protein